MLSLRVLRVLELLLNLATLHEVAVASYIHKSILIYSCDFHEVDNITSACAEFFFLMKKLDHKYATTILHL